MNLLILLNGKSDVIIEKHGLDRNNLEIIKLDEKDLANPGEMIKIMRRKPYDNIYFGCQDLEYLRFKKIIFIYLLLSIHPNGIIFDYNGKMLRYNTGYILLFVPIILIIKLFSATLIILLYTVKLSWLKLKLSRV